MALLGYGGAGGAVNPTAFSQTGTQNIFGTRPAPIPTPNPFGNLSGVYPNLSGTNSAVSGAIMNELQGNLSPAAIAAIQSAGAARGVSSGMPGSQLAVNATARDLGLSTEQLVQHGLGDYASLVPTISGTQTVNPALQTEIAATNAQNAAAPDPSAVESYAENLFNKYLTRMNGPGGGTGAFRGGTGAYSSNNVPWWAQGSGFGGGGAVLAGPGVGGTRSVSGAGVFDTPDAFGYNFTNPEAGTTAVLGAINPQAPYSNPNAYTQWLRNYGAATAGNDPGGELGI